MYKAFIVFILLCCCRLTAFSLKIFMTGDSHVAGKYYPLEVEEVLKEKHPDISFSFWGKIGAGFYTFNDEASYMEKIYEEKPDILIVHLGTNDSYARTFDTQTFLHNMSTFDAHVHHHLPDCRIVYVTPFYNKNRGKGSVKTYYKKRKGKKGRVRKTRKVKGPWQLNNNTRLCSEAINKFVSQHDHDYVIDNNAEHGMEFLEGKGLIRDDNVHLTVEGYKLLGDQVAEALLEIPALWQQEQSAEEVQIEIATVAEN